jgi:hypothetical protein
MKRWTRDSALVATVAAKMLCEHEMIMTLVLDLGARRSGRAVDRGIVHDKLEK